MIAVPHQLAQTIAQVFGEVGAQWLRGLPELVRACEQRWSIAALPPFANLSYNYVAPAVGANGAALVLKLGVPNPELRAEIAALGLYAGRGSVRLIDADPAAGALLLERLRPGAPLADLGDDERATLIAAEVMRLLWRPTPAEHPFPTVARWFRALRQLRARFDGGTGPLPARTFALAERLSEELLGSMAEPVLLHGDLHHGNILAAARRPWLAIDPKGLVGEPAYDVGALLRNPLPQLLAMPHPGRVLARRVDLLGETLGFDRRRVIGWGVTQAILSICWSLEEGDDAGWRGTLSCAELLAELLE